MSKDNLQTATLAGGCFWCTEAIFQRLRGIESVKPGYAGGTVDNPSYEDVSSGKTGHAEAIQVSFDPQVISYETILEIFFATHDPTTKNRQGNDVGPQYRSVIFYHDEEQKETALRMIAKLKNEGKHVDIVTEVTQYSNFYAAEDYHQDYYNTHKSFPYCTFVIDPKIRKLMEHFGKQVKEEYK